MRHGLELELSDQILSGNTLHSCPVLMEPYLLPQERGTLLLEAAHYGQSSLTEAAMGHIQTQVHCAHNYPGESSCEGLPFQGAPTLSSRASFLNTCTEQGTGIRDRFLLLLLPYPAQENTCQLPIPPTRAQPWNCGKGAHQGSRRLSGRH